MEITKQEFDTLRKYIHKIAGISLEQEKQYLVQQRLEPLVLSTGCGSFGEFCKKISSDCSFQLRDQIITAITTNETFFFRDNAPFKAFKDVMLPKLCDLISQRKNRATVRKGDKVKIWSAGSSTGQESFSLTILIHEYLKKKRPTDISVNDFTILATDISSKVLALAIDGRYNGIEMSRGLTPTHKSKYFRKEEEYWIINDRIRNMVEFRQVNLIQPFLHLGGFDIIFCRNVLIYFDLETKQRIIEQFYQLLSEDGFLIIGSSENLYGSANGFESKQVGGATVYQKSGTE